MVSSNTLWIRQLHILTHYTFKLEFCTVVHRLVILLPLKSFKGWILSGLWWTLDWRGTETAVTPHNSLETQTAHNYNFKVYPVVRWRAMFRSRKCALRWNNWESQTARQIHKFRKLPQYRSLSSEASCHISVDDNKTITITKEQIQLQLQFHNCYHANILMNNKLCWAAGNKMFNEHWASPF